MRQKHLSRSFSMLSKLLPWDFLSKFPTLMNIKKPGMYAFLITDPYLEKVVSDTLRENGFSFSLYTGTEITQDFIEKEFINLSFFSSTNHIKVMNSENISAENLNFLLETPAQWSEQFLLLFFNKSSKAFIDFVKNEKVMGFELLEPRHWDGATLWQFCQKVKKIKIPSDVSHFLLGAVEHNFESFFTAIDIIQLNFEKDKINLEELKNLIKCDRWNFFELADIFCINPKNFFSEVLKNVGGSYQWQQSLFSFMQGHLVKILAPEEIQKKEKLSLYDQKMLQASKKFPKKEIIAYVKFFSELEILAKSNDKFLINKLRLQLL